MLKPSQVLQLIQTRILIEVFPENFDFGEKISQISLKGSWDDWLHERPLQQYKEGFYTSMSLPPGSYSYKFIINQSHWRSLRGVPNDGPPHFNNTLRVEGAKTIVHQNLLEIRHFFNKLHKEMSFFGIREIFSVQKDFCVVKRYYDSFKKAIILVTRENNESAPETSNYELSMPEGTLMFKRLYYQTRTEEENVIFEEFDWSHFCSLSNRGDQIFLNFRGIPKNFVLVFKYEALRRTQETIEELNKSLHKDFCNEISEIEFSIEDLSNLLYSNFLSPLKSSLQ